MGNINQLACASIPVYNAQVPDEGPKEITLLLDFSEASEYVIDGKVLTDQPYISMVQTLWIDTTGASAAVTAFIEGSRQTIQANKATQGYYPVLCPNPFRITFDSSTETKVTVALINTPIAPAQWATS